MGEHKIFLVRHGHVELPHGRGKIFLGQKDLPLNKLGKYEAEIAGKKIKVYNEKIDYMYCSDLCRTLETANIIKEVLSFSPQVHEKKELREINLGDWDGLFMEEVKLQFPKEFETRGKDLLHYKINNAGESFFEMGQRAIKAYVDILNKEKDHKNIVIVAHSGVIRAILNYVLKKEPSEMFQQNPDYGDVYEIYHDGILKL